MLFIVGFLNVRLRFTVKIVPERLWKHLSNKLASKILKGPELM